jgi:hypothetical protein
VTLGREPGPERPGPSSAGLVWRRTIILLLATAIVGVPAGVLRALCAGRSCETPTEASAQVPFCSLPKEFRSRLAAGFREGRSPEVFGVTGSTAVRGHSGPGAPVWPSNREDDSVAGLAFWGTGIEGGAEIPSGTTLDAVAPTLAEVIALERPHPEVRSGEAIPGVVSDAAPPRLVILAVVESAPLGEPAESTGPWLDRVLSEGAATFEGDSGALPLDPAATMTSIGTGGRPREHGITGATIRNDDGELVRVWGRGAPPSVIATLADDLDDQLGGRPRIGMVATDPTERGLIGGNWYVEADEDDFTMARTPPKAARAAIDLIRSGYGDDDVVDLLGIVMRGDLEEVDAALADVHEAALSAAADSVTVAIVAVDGPSLESPSVSWRRVARSVERSVGATVVEGAAAGGLFTDQEVLAQKEIPEETIVDAMKSLRIDGQRLFVDVFSAISISFERYC